MVDRKNLLLLERRRKAGGTNGGTRLILIVLAPIGRSPPLICWHMKTPDYLEIDESIPRSLGGFGMLPYRLS